MSSPAISQIPSISQISHRFPMHSLPRPPRRTDTMRTRRGAQNLAVLFVRASLREDTHGAAQ